MFLSRTRFWLLFGLGLPLALQGLDYLPGLQGGSLQTSDWQRVGAAFAQDRRVRKPRIRAADLQALLTAKSSQWLAALAKLSAAPRQTRKVLGVFLSQPEPQLHPMRWRLFYLLSLVGKRGDLALLAPYWNRALSPKDQQAMEGVADALHPRLRNTNYLASGLNTVTFKPSQPVRIVAPNAAQSYWLPKQTLHALHADGVHPNQVRAIRSLIGKVFSSRSGLRRAMRARLGRGVNADVFAKQWAPLAQPAPFRVSRQGTVTIAFYNHSKYPLLVRPHLSVWFGRLRPNNPKRWRIVPSKKGALWRVHGRLQGDARRRNLRIDVHIEAWGGQRSRLFHSLSASKFLSIQRPAPAKKP